MNTTLDEHDLDSICGHHQNIGTAVVSPSGTWLRVNPYLCEMLGYSEEELLSMTFQQITHPDDLASEQDYLSRLIAGNIDRYRFEKRYYHQDGRIVWGMLDRTLVRDEARQPAYFISHIVDITAQKEAQLRQVGFFQTLGSRFNRLFRRG